MLTDGMIVRLWFYVVLCSLDAQVLIALYILPGVRLVLEENFLLN
jgi:hypothetical protein